MHRNERRRRVREWNKLMEPQRRRLPQQWGRVPERLWPDHARVMPSTGAVCVDLHVSVVADLMVTEWRRPDGTTWLAVNRLVVTDVKPDGKCLFGEGITWDELMECKRQAGHGDRWAVEVHPPDSQIVNAANMRHLWLLDEAPPYGWSDEG